MSRPNPDEAVFDEAAFDEFPVEAERFLLEHLLRRARPLLVVFDPDGALREMRGDSAHFGLDAVSGLQPLRDLLLGLDPDGALELPFVEMPNGRSAHVRIDRAGGGALRVLLIDAQEEHQRERDQQQIGNEQFLVGQQKTKAIEKLRQARAELERQRAQLEDANALKNALIATLSHDFRTPLTSIFGYLHLLEREPGADGAIRDQLRAVRRNATYLYTLAENLLEYGRIDSGVVTLLNPGLVDLATLAADLGAMFRPLAEDKGVAFDIVLDVEPGEMPVQDEIRLRQILINLLSNAVRYTLRGSVQATLRWRERRLRVEVRDTGIGIAPEFREQVFAPFNTGAHAGSRGAGLGLSIVRRLVTQMHGSIALESRLGEGSVFTVDLPPLAGGEPAEPPAYTVDPAAWLRNRSVLVVDDDPDVAHLLEVLLSDLGFRVRTVGDGEAALREVALESPDALLLDLNLADQSGNAVAYRLRASGYRGRILMLSASSLAESRVAALRAGADDYLTKPLNIEHFVRLMQRLH